VLNISENFSQLSFALIKLHFITYRRRDDDEIYYIHRSDFQFLSWKFMSQKNRKIIAQQTIKLSQYHKRKKDKFSPKNDERTNIKKVCLFFYFTFSYEIL
jgi:hypothetical protein